MGYDGTPSGGSGTALHGVSRTHDTVEWARAIERQLLRDRLRTIVPGLEQLDDPAAAPGDLIALADVQARHLRAELDDTRSEHRGHRDR